MDIQALLEPKKAGIRKVPGTTISNVRTGELIYTPPQHPQEIKRLLGNLVDYINDEQQSVFDPLVKMAIIHHQFESIHPFYDGNGPTGRILNILCLVKNDLLGLPILYLSRYIIRTKAEYYRLLQTVHEQNKWQEWVIYMIKGIEITARETIEFVEAIRGLMMETKQNLRQKLPKIYSQELLNNLFSKPYMTVSLIIDELKISRSTATKYLEKLVQHGFVNKSKYGRMNLYVNEPLMKLIIQQEAKEP